MVTSFLRLRRRKNQSALQLSTRPKFTVDETLERRADAARIAMGESHLLAVPVERKTPRAPIDYETELPIG